MEGMESDLNLGKEIFGFDGDDGIMAAFLGSKEGSQLWKEIGESILSEGKVENKDQEINPATGLLSLCKSDTTQEHLFH
jgi:hypothetical protein